MVNNFAKLFKDSVRIRMRSDVEFGAFLSGGLDSSCIVSAMSEHTTKQIKTFTMGFESRQFDERHLARLVSDKYKTDHFIAMITSEDFDGAVDTILEQFDDPFGDASAIPTGHISKYASQHIKMVLTGDGGDEVLSGYTIYKGEKFAKQYQALPSGVRYLLPKLLKLSSTPFRGNLRFKLNWVAKILESSNLPFEKRLHTKISQIPPGLLSKLISPQAKSISFQDYYEDVMKGCKFQESFYKLMYFQHKVTLPGDMLAKVDRMSMAYSIETRIPFLDHRIIELLFRAHKDLKTTGYLNKTILRNAVANHALPKDLLSAPKKGFNVPLREWFKEDDLNAKIKDILLNNNDDKVFITTEVEKLISQNCTGKADAGNFIWVILILKKWLDSRNNLQSINFQKKEGIKF